MRILQIHNKYLYVGGEDITVEREKNLLVQQGHQVEQLFFDNKSIKGLKKLYFLYAIFYNIQSAKIVKRKLIQFKPDIIHVHNFFYVASPSIFFIIKKMRIPVVVTLHNFRLNCINGILLRKGKICELCLKHKLPLNGIRYKCFQNSYLKSLQLTLITSIHKYLHTWENKITKYIVFTDFLKHKLIMSSLQINDEQIAVKSNFLEDPCLYKAGIQKKDYFLYVGRLSTEKGIDILLEATKNNDFELHIIGAGDLENLVGDYAQHNTNIHFHGFQNYHFIIEKIKFARALIFPSICYEGGTPLTILESLSCGTPVIISNINNLNQIITDAHDGFHFTTGNAKDLASKIKLVQNIDTNKINNNAHNTYLEKYTSEKNYAILMSIYKKTIQNTNYLKAK